MLRMILNQAFNKARGLYKAENHDAIYIFGDLNFRVNLKNKEARQAIIESNINFMKQHDELTIIRNSEAQFDSGQILELDDDLRGELVKNEIFNKFQEGEIDFFPTYKFDKGTNNYDSSSKKRVPSWTDRILFTGKQSVMSLLEY
jgi:inositol-1,4,5-trisphosphate 5-phosphatase